MSIWTWLILRIGGKKYRKMAKRRKHGHSMANGNSMSCWQKKLKRNPSFKAYQYPFPTGSAYTAWREKHGQRYDPPPPVSYQDDERQPQRRRA